MTRECPQCGEPLLGAVNRCWKCGLDLRAQARPGLQPANLASHEPLILAELADAPPPETVQAPVQVAPAATVSQGGPEPHYLEFGLNGSMIRRGSPFVPGAPLLPPQKPAGFGSTAARRKPDLYRAYASSGGAFAGLVLGIFGLAISPFTVQGAVVGALGLGMGIWGLYSTRRIWAQFGLVFCSLAIGVGLYTLVRWMFEVGILTA